MIKQTLAVTLLGILALSGGAASAASPQTDFDQVAVKVSYAGLDINSEEGARILLHRIDRAAGEVCGGPPSNRQDRLRWYRPCKKEVVQRTVSGINSPTLRALAGVESPMTVAQQTPSR
jgi:UrcA family protein